MSLLDFEIWLMKLSVFYYSHKCLFVLFSIMRQASNFFLLLLYFVILFRLYRYAVHETRTTQELSKNISYKPKSFIHSDFSLYNLCSNTHHSINACLPHCRNKTLQKRKKYIVLQKNLRLIKQTNKHTNNRNTPLPVLG